MPGRSGIDLIKQIKSEKPKLPNLVLSMHKEDEYAVRSIRAPRDAASDLIGTTLIFSLMFGPANGGLSNEAE